MRRIGYTLLGLFLVVFSPIILALWLIVEVMNGLHAMGRGFWKGTDV